LDIDRVKETAYYHTSIKEWPEDERPREKLLVDGPGSLSDSELIALLIGSGTRGITAVDLGKRLLVSHDNLTGLSKSGLPELTRLKGIGPAAASRIAAAFELGRRAASGKTESRIKINVPQDAVKHYGPVLRDLPTEVFKILLLDNRNQVLRDEILTKGTLNASIVHPREVFKAAIDFRAAGLIVMHNHPSGNNNPSPEDRKVTRQLIKAGEIMGIPVIDHLIIAGNSYYSFAEEGGLN